MLLETDCFDCGIHDRTADLSARDRQADDAADVQIRS
jgi:Zn ribbon nucleic-acid-binding protein